MEYGKWLIDKAAEVCGSRYALAKRMNVDEGNLSRYAKKGPPIEWIPALAEIAGEEPGQAVLRVLAERASAKKPPTLGAWGAAGGAGMLLISYAISVGHHPKLLAVTTACLDCLRIVSSKGRHLLTAPPLRNYSLSSSLRSCAGSNRSEVPLPA